MRRLVLLALALVPVGFLWRRQLAFERYLAGSMEDYAERTNDEIEKTMKAWKRWGDNLVNEIKREARR